MESISTIKRRSSGISDIEKYLIKESKSEVKHEYYNGKIRKMPGSSYNHNLIALQLSSAILVEVEKQQ
jgi:Uma2 family endonuclease